MPSAAYLHRLRQRFDDELPDRALIERPTQVSDGGGGFTQTWATLAASVPCRLAPVGGGEDERGRSTSGDRIVDEATATIAFAAGQDITESDRVTIDGQAFDVLLVRLRGKYELTRRVEARESA